MCNFISQTLAFVSFHRSLHVFKRLPESEILNDARLYDEVQVDDAWAADSV